MYYISTRRILRILPSGDVVQPNCLLMGQDPKNITGRLINVWALPLLCHKHPALEILCKLWFLIEDLLQFKSNYLALNDIPRRKEFISGVILRPFSYRISNHWQIIAPFRKAWYVLIIAKPSQGQTSSFYISTLSLSSWTAAVGTILILLAVMWIMFTMCPKLNQDSRRSHFSDCLLIISRIVTNRALVSIPRRASLRIFYITAAMFAFVFLIFYSALLTSKLAVSIAPNPINNLEDITKRRTHQLCLGTTWAVKYFYNDQGTYQTKWHDLIDGPSCEKIRFDKFCTRKVIKLLHYRSIEYNDGTKFGDCVVISLKEKIIPHTITLLAASNFPYTASINSAALKLVNVGIENYWSRKLTHSAPSPYAVKETYLEVSLSNVAGLFAYYLIMVLLSIILFLMEIIYHCLTLRQQ